MNEQSLVIWTEFLTQTGVPEARILELMDLGWLQAAATLENQRYFRQIDVYRIRKLDRLCDDFELPPMAGAIIVDLLERIESLELRLKELNG